MYYVGEDLTIDINIVDDSLHSLEILQNSTVRDLLHALRSDGDRYCLCTKGNKVLDPQSTFTSLGIKSGEELRGNVVWIKLRYSLFHRYFNEEESNIYRQSEEHEFWVWFWWGTNSRCLSETTLDSLFHDIISFVDSLQETVWHGKETICYYLYESTGEPWYQADIAFSRSKGFRYIR